MGASAPLLTFWLPRVVLAFAAAVASGAEVRPLLDVALALERTVLTGVLSWVVGVVVVVAVVFPDLAVVTFLEGVSVVVAAEPLPVERAVPVFVCLRVVVL